MLLPLTYRKVARDLLISTMYGMRRTTTWHLVYVADAYGIDEKAEQEAMALRKAWIAHPDHTILKAMVAERAIFFRSTPILSI